MTKCVLWFQLEINCNLLGPNWPILWDIFLKKLCTLCFLWSQASRVFYIRSTSVSAEVSESLFPFTRRGRVHNVVKQNLSYLFEAGFWLQPVVQSNHIAGYNGANMYISVINKWSKSRRKLNEFKSKNSHWFWPRVSVQLYFDPIMWF